MLIPLAIMASDINIYSFFQISKIIISDIRNYAEQAFYLKYPNIFWISKITISDIQK